MPAVVAPRRVKVRAGRRALKLLADQAIGHDLLKGLLELVTNSDESYARLEKAGQQRSGKIEIEIDRRPRKKQTIVRVIDWAEGMDHVQQEKCVAGYGEDTSGQVGRGVFGMGLKDTINAFGEGEITSFKQGKKYKCRLQNVEDLEIDGPESLSATDKRDFRNSSGGTVVEIIVTNSKVKIPLVDSLREQLQTHVCLRPIMTDSTRFVSLRDLRSGSSDEIHYEMPDGEVLLDSKELRLANYPSVTAKLTVRRAVGPEALTQTGSYRTGGILITSKRTCHEASLFGFDEDPHAARLFGELRCDAIYDLQAGGDQIVDKNRNGLRKDHQLTRDLNNAARAEVEKLVSLEKERERQRRQALEREETLKRFRDAVRNLNEIARTELQIGGVGPGTDERPFSEMRVPQDGFEFIPDTYRIVVAQREMLKLRVQVDGSTGMGVGDKIEISCDNPRIRILDNAPSVPKLSQEAPPLAIIHIPVEGVQANAQGFVTAKFGTKVAIAAVEVVSSKKQTERHPTSGLFKEIRYEERPDQRVRARFDRKAGTIWINTLGPSVDMYFGPGGEHQELPPNQVLVAEFVTELACQEIARVKREAKFLDIPPGVDELEAYSQHITTLKGTYAPLIHRVLVAPECRRK